MTTVTRDITATIVVKNANIESASVVTNGAKLGVCKQEPKPRKVPCETVMYAHDHYVDGGFPANFLIVQLILTVLHEDGTR